MAFYTDLYIDQGTSYNAVLPVKALNGLPLDLTEYDGRGQIRRNFKSSQATNFNIDIVDPTAGLINISLTPTQTGALKAGRYVFDIEVYTTNNADVIRVIEGQVTINPRATQP